MILRELADRLGCALRGDGAVEVDRVAPIDAAGPGSLTFVASAKWAVRLKTTQATAVIVQPSVATPLPSLLSDNPYLMFARAVLLLHPKAALPPGVHPSAVVHATAALDESARLYALPAAESFAIQQPLGRLLRPEEMAAVIAFLAGEDASGMTGAIVPVDGGLAL